ncbi:ribosomal RNA small subunit methyltransferase A [Candidatus Peregrinibacteria bacterium]|jgi:16S rRNA (adenine1518-N6/adenine1519-N6)-dimethyltransferase|nr:ribosomal RNA small subunit methyltransferase A [Candidatus Peregrinibacteria bacterium]MBT4147889.1 ribosomal RNA small subunit methyltransferase A [Candidatus Peregrinibacteria bacterium]MBT4365906.1 ribosomal RNA small subunit methyltransferase A [Candidatus Peregrinibacteria bacterium]MBT4456380.1 ribosomal RNA small subunit methyltransferase A [Candidatus Peregrinibacteria bacterium]
MSHKAKKHLGQNFLQSQTIVEQIVETAEVTNKDRILEIGPGLGILTEELAKKAAHTTAIEIDQDLIPGLKNNPALARVEIINEDALQFTPPKTGKYKIVANIPYYITSPLITHFLTTENPPVSTTLLIQKEVAEKIVTDPPESILALQIQLYAEPTLAFLVPAKHFNPKPKVDSAVIHLETLQKNARTKNPEKILKLAKQAFSQKRKKLSNTLRDYKPQLTKLDLQDKRPQHLTIKDWEQLANNIK